jgi:hypothetical protein
MVLFFGMTIPWSAFLGAPDPFRSLELARIQY